VFCSFLIARRGETVVVLVEGSMGLLLSVAVNLFRLLCFLFHRVFIC